MSTPHLDPTAQTPPRPRSLLGFLFKTTLGCTAFAFGSLLVLVLLLPTLLAGTATSRGAAAFDARYQGRLEIGSASLAWFGEQSVRGVRLLDPSGAEVLRADATLPSLWSLIRSGGTRLGTIVLDVDATLAADEAGTTNLQRALAPRGASSGTGGQPGGDEAPFDAAAFVRDLDADVRVNVKHLSWSDADTRRLGKPFVIEDAVLHAFKKPSTPLVALVTGRIAGEKPGTLEVDVKVDGPIDPAARWPLGRTQAKGRIEGFSTALVDGLAGLSGDLVEVLGPTFALRFDVKAESAEQGTADLELDGANADVAIHARLAGGEITGGDQPFLTATTPMPRGILERVLRAKLPPDARVTLADAGKSWTVRVPKLRLPLPDPKARDMASLRPALEKAEIDVEVDLPGSATIETDALRAAKLTAGISAMKLTARAAPGQPLAAHFEAALDAGAPGSMRVDATVPDAFGMLAGGPVPPLHLVARIDGLSMLALGEFSGQGARIASAIGPVASLSIEVRDANLERGDVSVLLNSAHANASLHARIVDGALTSHPAAPTLVSWQPTPEFVAAEIGPRLPSGSSIELSGPLQVSLTALSAPLRDARSGAFVGVDALLAGLAARLDVNLPNAAWNSAETRAAGAPAEVRGAKLELQVAAGAPPRVQLGADVLLNGPTRPAARLEVEARPREPLLALRSGTSPSGSVDLTLRGLDTVTLEKLAGQPDQLAPLLGPALDLVVRAEGPLPTSGSLDVSLVGASGRVGVKGRLADGQFVATGDEGLQANIQVTPELLRARLGPSLPAGTRVELAGTGPSAITISVREFATPLEAPDVARRLAGTSAKLEVVLPSIAYADAKTDAAKRAVVLSGARLSAALSPTVKPSLRFSAKVEDTPPGELALDLVALDPLEKLQGEGAWKTFRASARVHAENVPTALVDALAGQNGLLVEALGDRILIDVQAPEVAFDRGTIEARVESGKNRVVLAAHLEDGTLVIDKTDGLDVDVALGPLVMDRVVGSLLPMLKKASFLGAVDAQQVTSSAEFEPFLLNSSDVHFALGSDVSKLSGVFRIDLGTLSFKGLPMLEQLGVSLEAADVRLPAFSVPIKDGVAVYDKLPIRLGGREILFDGSVRLVDGEMSLATKLPLAMFGKKFDKELGKIREFVPLDTAVPIVLSGTWNKPRVGFQDGFLKGLLESAAGKAAEKGLDDLLDGLLGGKKKKKDG
ncbi:MAG: hypothetical protein NTY35_14145 [Planctomycetota bacterium]|nr:hypothetical protein [Planctomycetota bacterium]